MNTASLVNRLITFVREKGRQRGRIYFQSNRTVPFLVHQGLPMTDFFLIVVAAIGCTVSSTPNANISFWIVS